MVMAPALAMLILPGFSSASFKNSSKVFQGASGLTTSTQGQFTRREIGLRSLIGSNGILPTKRFKAKRWLPP